METLEGTWEELARHVDKFAGHRLRVVILPDEAPRPRPQQIVKGMFPQLVAVTEEDFKAAEYQSRDDEELVDAA